MKVKPARLTTKAERDELARKLKTRNLGFEEKTTKFAREANKRLEDFCKGFPK